MSFPSNMTATSTADSQNPIGAYLAAAEECGRSGIGSGACQRALALQAAALAAGLDPSIAKAASDCIGSGSVEGCAKASAAAGLTAACIAATSGAATLACGPLSSIIVNVAWPVVWGTFVNAFNVATSLASVGLEAVGLKDAPEFADLAVPMHAAAAAQIISSIANSSKAIADGIRKSREAIGIGDDDSILIRRWEEDPRKAGATYRLSRDGELKQLDQAVQDMIWDRMANDSSFVAGFSSVSDCGTVWLTAGSMGSDRKANIASAHTLISLRPGWQVHWDYAWERGDCMQWGADKLAQFYGHRFEAMQKAISRALDNMVAMEAANPATVEALQASQGAGMVSNGSKPAKSGSGGALLAVGILGMLGAAGYYAWTKYAR